MDRAITTARIELLNYTESRTVAAGVSPDLFPAARQATATKPASAVDCVDGNGMPRRAVCGGSAWAYVPGTYVGRRPLVSLGVSGRLDRLVAAGTDVSRSNSETYS